MKSIYKEIWKLAKPYYEKGRPQNINHIEWMMKEALKVCQNEKIDETILLPLVILHDVGYAETGPAYFEKNLKKAHMIAGAKIAEKILKKLKYPENKIKKIAGYILVHDNWIFGENDIYNKDILLGTFHDLDFIWMTSKKGFKSVMEILNKNEKELLEFIGKDEKPVSRPFKTKTTKKLWETSLAKRKKEVNFK